MTTFSAKIFEVFRNLKSDAVPRAPRPEEDELNTPNDVTEENNENVDTSNEYDYEEIVIEPEDLKKGDDPKPKSKKSPKSKKKGFSFSKSDKATEKKNKSVNNVNTQASGNVINIVGVNGLHWGNVFVNNFGASSADNKNPKNDFKDNVNKCNLVTLVMEAKVKPEHQYIDYISKNLGKNWHSFFRKLGYTQGRIETFEIDEAKNGVSEARYKLLLDWVRNDEDGTLGRLATQLWDEGERHVVKELALIYKSNKN